MARFFERHAVATSANEAVFSRDGKSNLGAVFIGFDAVDENGVNRGIGFHGHSENLLAVTDGCIRMYNDDLLLLEPLMKKEGIKIYIV